MDNKNSTDEKQSKQERKQDELSTSKKKLVFIFAIIFLVLVVSGIYIKENFSRKTTGQLISQEGLQGPAEVSTLVQQDCQASAKKILEAKECSLKKEILTANVDGCLSVYFALDNAEGNFGDLSIHVARCFFEQGRDSVSAQSVIDLMLEKPEWEMFQGPISCPSNPILNSYKESFAADKKFQCIKSSDLSSLIEKLKRKEFSILFDLVPPGQLVYQGYADSDASCPENSLSIQATLNRLLNNEFTIVEAKNEAGADDALLNSKDRYLEVVNDRKKILNLHFKIDTNDCLEFHSLLAESLETSE